MQHHIGQHQGPGNGDGNGYIQVTAEDLEAWQQLSLAGFIPNQITLGSYKIGLGIPPSKLKGGGFYLVGDTAYGKTRNGIWFAGENQFGFTGPVTNTPDAMSIDKKNDDGDADNGDVVTANGYIGVSEQTGCVSATGMPPPIPSTYTLSNQDKKCRIRFWLE